MEKGSRKLAMHSFKISLHMYPSITSLMSFTGGYQTRDCWHHSPLDSFSGLRNMQLTCSRRAQPWPRHCSLCEPWLILLDWSSFGSCSWLFLQITSPLFMVCLIFFSFSCLKMMNAFVLLSVWIGMIIGILSKRVC